MQASKACWEACEEQMSKEGLPLEAMKTFKQMFEPIPTDNLKTSKGEVHEFSEIGGRSYTVRNYAQLRTLIKT